MPDRKYWQKRFEQLEEVQLNKGIEYYHELEKQYMKAASEIQKEITNWYARFSTNNEISMTEAKKILNNRELEELRWDVEEYIKAGRESNVNGKWIKELENASARVHIDRLESLKLQMQQQVEVLYGNELDSFDKMMRDIYTEGYYRTAFEIQKGMGVGADLMRLDENKVRKVLAKPWAADGSNFSSRIWKQRSQLVNELHNQLTQAIIRGTAPDDAIKTIAERFKVSKGQAGRLVMTEAAFFHSAAQKDSFIDLGVEKYEICATLDNKTSEICRELDGKTFDMKDFQPGVTAPPFHCWCRTTTVPYFDDEFTEGEVRVATDEDGKTYYVPANMKYHEWKETFVDGGSKKDLTPITSEKQIEKIIADTPVARTVADINAEATEKLLDSYEDRRTHFNLNLTSADDLRTMGNMNPITVSYDGVSLETAEAFDDTIQALSDEYLTGFTKIEVGNKKDFFGANIFATTQHNNLVGQKTLVLNPHKTGDYDKMVERIRELSDKGYAVNITEGFEGRYIATHEFAHSLIDLSGDYKNYVGMNVKQMRVIKKEIDSIFDNYKKEVNALESICKEKELAFLNASISLDVDMDDLARMQKEALEAKQAYDAIKISKYSTENADEFMAEAFTQSKIGVSQSKYSDDVMGVIDKYFKKKPVETALNNGIIKPDKVVCGHDGTPKKAGSGMVIDHLGKDNRTETRTFYGESGYKKKDITNHNHGFPAKHPYGKSGEHAHDYEWDADGELKKRTTREITDDERKENSDIL